MNTEPNTAATSAAAAAASAPTTSTPPKAVDHAAEATAMARQENVHKVGKTGIQRDAWKRRRALELGEIKS